MVYVLTLVCLVLVLRGTFIRYAVTGPRRPFLRKSLSFAAVCLHSTSCFACSSGESGCGAAVTGFAGARRLGLNGGRARRIHDTNPSRCEVRLLSEHHFEYLAASCATLCCGKSFCSSSTSEASVAVAAMCSQLARSCGSGVRATATTLFLSFLVSLLVSGRQMVVRWSSDGCADGCRNVVLPLNLMVALTAVFWARFGRVLGAVCSACPAA